MTGVQTCALPILHENSVTMLTIDAVDVGLNRASVEDLRGGDAAFNANALSRVLRGEDRGPHRDALVLGTAIALECTGRASNGKEGVAEASSSIDDGRAALVLDRLQEFGA